MRVLPRSIVVGRYMAARTGAAWHNGGSRTVAAVRLPGFRDSLSYPSGCSAGMQSPRSAAAVSSSLLQRSGLSASCQGPAAVEADDGLSPLPSHLLSTEQLPGRNTGVPGWRRGGIPIVPLCTVISGSFLRRALSQTPVTWTPPAPPARRRTYWEHERTNEHHPSHVRVYSCPNVQLTPTSAIP